MLWIVLGVCVLFAGLEVWVLCRASARREQAWDEVVG